MSIEKKCENCANYQIIDDDEYYCNCLGGTHYKRPCVENNLMFFRPSEKAIREDEREKMIEKIKKFYHPARNDKFSNSMNFLELLVYLKED